MTRFWAGPCRRQIATNGSFPGMWRDMSWAPKKKVAPTTPFCLGIPKKGLSAKEPKRTSPTRESHERHGQGQEALPLAGQAEYAEEPLAQQAPRGACSRDPAVQKSTELAKAQDDNKRLRREAASARGELWHVKQARWPRHKRACDTFA